MPDGKNGYAFFRNTECEYFPCHADADAESFNCLFCYCPLYVLGRGCGGDFTYSDTGIKDCSACIVPHSPGGWEYVTDRFADITKAMDSREK